MVAELKAAPDRVSLPEVASTFVTSEPGGGARFSGTSDRPSTSTVMASPDVFTAAAAGCCESFMRIEIVSPSWAIWMSLMRADTLELAGADWA